MLELKRGGKPVTAADVEQGLAYARMLHPRPPLVVATNGIETRIVETHTGDDWIPSEPSATELAALIAAAAKVASVDTKEAVSILLGTGSQVWMAAVRAATAATLADLSGGWDDPLRPFVAEFLIPRLATQAVLAALQGGHKTVILTGPPLAGKSSVLQLLVIAAGVMVPVMYALGAIFAGFWALAIWMGRRYESAGAPRAAPPGSGPPR